MRLATAESCLKLHDRLTAPASEALRNLRQQKRHALGDEGAVEERAGILILAAGFAGANCRDVGGELRLLERAFKHVLMGYSHFSPRFHSWLPLQPNRSL
ncbi:hypothetical protein [Mesorhizobium sp.]|uniref:hypothetical protein n=1 Tax=Mesorhizobium sp. TaxID=1871066 RepID=UPI00257FBB55|nr:hypothetical protein [Mesorhizobium sp.]